MAKYLIIAVVTIAVVTGALFLINKFGQEARVTLSAKPWIEIVSPSVVEVNEKGDAVRQLKTGDELTAGSVIEGKVGSFANIYFPDGSTARIDGATKISLDEYLFDESRDRLVVRLSVTVGRLWNKIFELATPDSVWEVKTATAVATVRGTAFGVEVSDGKIGFIGSQNNVEVAPIDPETKEIIKEARLIIAAGDVVEIAKEDIQRARREAKIIALKVQKVAEAAPAAVAAVKQDWVTRAKAADVEFDSQVSELRKIVKEKSALRRGIRESIKKVRDEIKQNIKNTRDAGAGNFDVIKGELKQDLKQLPAGKVLERVIQERLKLSDEPATAIKSDLQEVVGQVKPASNSADINTSGGASVTATKSLSRPSKIILESASDFSKAVKEGAKVFFKAVLIREDRSSEPVTDTADWKVVGSIGSIEKPGVFLSRLGDNVAEFGTGVGTVVATWKDPVSGGVFLGQSPVITVEPNIVPVFVPDGG